MWIISYYPSEIQPNKKNDRCLLDLQNISSKIEIVSPLLNFLFQTPNLYSTKREMNCNVSYLLLFIWDTAWIRKLICFSQIMSSIYHIKMYPYYQISYAFN